MVEPRGKALISGLPDGRKRQYWEHLLQIEYRKNNKMSSLIGRILLGSEYEVDNFRYPTSTGFAVAILPQSRQEQNTEKHITLIQTIVKY